MKAVVDQDGCISCGLCVSACPDVFRFDDNEKAEAYGNVNPDNEEQAIEAQDGCPVSVITVGE